MKPAAKQLITGLVATTLFGLSPLAAAISGIKANNAYIGDIHGEVVSDGRGQCVRTIHWTPELALPGCEPGMAPKPVAAAPKPAPAPEPAPVPKPAPVVEKVSLKAGALFDSGKADIKPAGQRELDELATRLKADPGIESIQITGHTDSQGQAAFNQNLSERRADAVKTYLVAKGVNADLIKASGMGASSPVASNATADGRAQNRRVEVDITASKTVSP